LVHPGAWFGLLRAFELDATNAETLTNQGVEIHSDEKHVATKGRRLEIRKRELLFHVFIDCEIKEGDLAFEVFLEVEIAISGNPSARDAFDFVPVFDPVIERFFAVSAFEVVPGGYQ